MPVFAASAYFQICHKSDPEIGSCINRTIDDLRPRLIKGNAHAHLIQILRNCRSATKILLSLH
jgi:hypothetical protein